MKITLHVSFYRHNTAGVQKKLSKLLSLLVILLGWAISGSARIILICNDVCESAQMGIRNRTSVALPAMLLKCHFITLSKQPHTYLQKFLPHPLCKALHYLPRDSRCPISSPPRFMPIFLGFPVDKQTHTKCVSMINCSVSLFSSKVSLILNSTNP